MTSDYKPRLLKLAAYDNPILRNKVKPVTFPLSVADQHIIADMIYSLQPEQLRAADAPWEHPVGMAANQWGIDKSIFLYCPSGDTVDDVTVIINPSYEVVPTLAIIAPSEQSDWEGCFSIPLSTGYIKRGTKIKIQYQDEQGQVFAAELSDWPARVWQHETDHLNGYLYDDPRHGRCLEKRVFKTVAEVDGFYDAIRETRKTK